MNILGVVLSQFHHQAGKRLATSDPPQNPLTKEQFKLVTNLILPRQSLCGRILAVQFLQEYFLVVFPILSLNSESDNKYKRELYYYSISIIVDRKDYLRKAQQILYKEVVTKLASFFKVMEETHHIIYKCFDNPKYTHYLYSILKHFRAEINSRGECDLTHLCTHYTFINANKSPFTIQSNQRDFNCATVPITLLTSAQIQKTESQFGKQLLRYAYQGTYTLRKISRLHRDRKQAQIRSFYLKGAEKGLIYLLDMFSLNNCYALTEKIKEYLPEQPRHSQLAQILKSICTKPQKTEPQELLCIYLQFTRTTPLYKIVELNRKLFARIDVHKLVRFGQIIGIIKRVHQKIVYSHFPEPLIVPQALKRILQQRGSVVSEKLLQQQSDKLEEIVKNDVMSGCTVDEISVGLEVDYDKLMKLLNPQNRFVFKING